MVSQKITVKNMTGFHLRPAGVLCKEALRYKSKISFKIRRDLMQDRNELQIKGSVSV